MKISEVLIMLLCNPEGDVCIHGSDEDKKMLSFAINRVRELEEWIDSMPKNHVAKRLA